jgi:hypothetical protein
MTHTQMKLEFAKSMNQLRKMAAKQKAKKVSTKVSWNENWNYEF